MPTKAELYAQMAEKVATQLTGCLLYTSAMPFRKGISISCDSQTVINDKKVTDHHAVIPTRNLKDADLSALPAGEKAVLELVALRLLCAVAQPHIYSETVVIADCAGAVSYTHLDVYKRQVL